MVRNIYLRCVELGISLDMEWKPREDSLLKLMDKGSRTGVFPAEEFSLGFDDYILLSNKFGPFDVDLMATSLNKKAAAYFSKGLKLNSKGVDVFKQTLELGVKYYVIPPPKLVLKILLHLQKFQAKGLVILPMWPSAAWFSKIFPEGPMMSFVKEFMLVNPFFLADDNATSQVFRGKSSFLCMDMYVDV